MQGMKLRRVNDEVFFADEPVVSIGPEEIEFVTRQALTSTRRRARICLHRSEVDAVQEMLIAVDAQSYVRPHRHAQRNESFHVVSGTADVVLFDDAGRVVERVRLAADDRGMRYFRVDVGRFHCLLVRTPMFVLFETTTGPFVRNETEYAAWSPADGNEAEIRHYLVKLEAQLAR
jgi:cupin fold WbuC family metalloprotein